MIVAVFVIIAGFGIATTMLVFSIVNFMQGNIGWGVGLTASASIPFVIGLFPLIALVDSIRSERQGSSHSILQKYTDILNQAIEMAAMLYAYYVNANLGVSAQNIIFNGNRRVMLLSGALVSTCFDVIEQDIIGLTSWYYRDKIASRRTRRKSVMGWSDQQQMSLGSAGIIYAHLHYAIMRKQAKIEDCINFHKQYLKKISEMDQIGTVRQRFDGRTASGETDAVRRAQMYCTNCGTKFEGNFCPRCGAAAYILEDEKKPGGHPLASDTIPEPEAVPEKNTEPLPETSELLSDASKTVDEENNMYMCSKCMHIIIVDGASPPEGKCSDCDGKIVSLDCTKGKWEESSPDEQKAIMQEAVEPFVKAQVRGKGLLFTGCAALGAEILASIAFGTALPAATFAAAAIFIVVGLVRMSNSRKATEKEIAETIDNAWLAMQPGYKSEEPVPDEKPIERIAFQTNCAVANGGVLLAVEHKGNEILLVDCPFVSKGETCHALTDGAGITCPVAIDYISHN